MNGSLSVGRYPSGKATIRADDPRLVRFGEDFTSLTLGIVGAWPLPGSGILCAAFFTVRLLSDFPILSPDLRIFH
jgi:hypothetical protein